MEAVNKDVMWSTINEFNCKRVVYDELERINKHRSLYVVNNADDIYKHKLTLMYDHIEDEIVNGVVEYESGRTLLPIDVLLDKFMIEYTEYIKYINDNPGYNFKNTKNTLVFEKLFNRIKELALKKFKASYDRYYDSLENNRQVMAKAYQRDLYLSQFYNSELDNMSMYHVDPSLLDDDQIIMIFLYSKGLVSRKIYQRLVSILKKDDFNILDYETRNINIFVDYLSKHNPKLLIDVINRSTSEDKVKNNSSWSINRYLLDVKTKVCIKMGSL